MSTSEPFRLTAVDAVAALRRREVSPTELLDAAAARIEVCEPHLNALPTLCLERAREHARRIERGEQQPRHPECWLAGLPVAIKDLNAVAGVRCTLGSPIYRDWVPDYSDHLVERLEANGAVVVGKSNTPEFGAGPSTFNEVFGRTHNPWNLSKSVAGSSGGAAAALAAGEVWLAQGSDLGGSLRLPASFNSTVGLRPSPGRVPRGPMRSSFDTLAVEGPIARTPGDLALFLDALSGHCPRDPLSFDTPPGLFQAAVRERRPPRRVAFSPDLGILPVDPEVRALCAAAARRLEETGAVVEEACPDLSGAIDAFQVLRAALFASEHADHLREHRGDLKPEVIWNIEKGLAISADEIGRAEVARGRIHTALVRFLEDWDLLLCPVSIVPPFDVETRWVEEVDGHRFDNYIEWAAMTFVLSLTGCPALSAPAGFTTAGLPVGVQIIGPPRGEAACIAAAACLDDLTGLSARLPIDPRDARGRPVL